MNVKDGSDETMNAMLCKDNSLKDRGPQQIKADNRSCY